MSRRSPRTRCGTAQRPCPGALWGSGPEGSGRNGPGNADGRTLETPSDRSCEPGVLIGDHQTNTAEPTVLQRPEERPPERIVFAVTNIKSEDFALPAGGDPGRHDNSFGDDLVIVADMKVGRVKVDVRKAGVVQITGPPNRPRACSCSGFQYSGRGSTHRVVSTLRPILDP